MSEDGRLDFDLGPDEPGPDQEPHSEIWRLIGLPGCEFSELASGALMRAWGYPGEPWASDFARLRQLRGRGHAYQEIVERLAAQAEEEPGHSGPVVAILSILLADEFDRLQPSWESVYRLAEQSTISPELRGLLRSVADGVEVDRPEALGCLRRALQHGSVDPSALARAASEITEADLTDNDVWIRSREARAFLGTGSKSTFNKYREGAGFPKPRKAGNAHLWPALQLAAWATSQPVAIQVDMGGLDPENRTKVQSRASSNEERASRAQAFTEGLREVRGRSSQRTRGGDD